MILGRIGIPNCKVDEGLDRRERWSRLSLFGPEARTLEVLVWQRGCRSHPRSGPLGVGSLAQKLTNAGHFSSERCFSHQVVSLSSSSVAIPFLAWPLVRWLQRLGPATKRKEEILECCFAMLGRVAKPTFTLGSLLRVKVCERIRAKLQSPKSYWATGFTSRPKLKGPYARDVDAWFGENICDLFKSQPSQWHERAASGVWGVHHNSVSWF